jgi:hypothetical protein
MAARDVYEAIMCSWTLAPAPLRDVPGLAAAKPLTHVEARYLERSFDHLIVLGGG